MVVCFWAVGFLSVLFCAQAENIRQSVKIESDNNRMLFFIIKVFLFDVKVLRYLRGGLSVSLQNIDFYRKLNISMAQQKLL